MANFAGKGGTKSYPLNNLMQFLARVPSPVY